MEETEIDPDALIERYAVIGDTGTAALVSSDGSIDWLCVPNFDSDPVFAKLLDPGGGHCSVVAQGYVSSTRRYLPGTPVLETTLATQSGRATLTDFFVALPRRRKDASLVPFRWLCRRLEGVDGLVSVSVEVAPRDAFGGGKWSLRVDGGLLTCLRGGKAMFVSGSAPFRIDGSTATTRIEVEAGQRAHVSLSYAERDVGVVPPGDTAVDAAFEQTVAGWEEWSSRIQGGTRYRQQVERAVITLKLLTFAASGAVVAAPTTSLPEAVGAGLNWDYRYPWVRDASRSVISLGEHGHAEDAKAYLFWLANATRLTAPHVRTLYALNGERAGAERSIEGLRGYRGSLPVRKGNAAADQLQLDNWAYLADAALAFTRQGRRLPDDVWSLVKRHAEFAAGNWRRPDRGIWEIRDAPRHFVHSKVMCWVTLDRSLALASALDQTAPTQRWRGAAEEIKETVLRDGIDPEHGGFVRAFGDRDIDASLLELAIVGFVDGEDPRMIATIDRVRSELGHGDLVMRYRTKDGDGGEGAFLPCSFWLAHALALAGRRDEAVDVFERACRRANDVGLLPEEIDPDSGSFLGNFPQGLTLLALLAAARALEDQPLEDQPHEDQPRG